MGTGKQENRRTGEQEKKKAAPKGSGFLFSQQ